MNTIAPYAKALTAALAAFLTALATSLDDGVISQQEWLLSAAGLIVALSAVWAVPNKDPEADHQDESVQPPMA